MNITFSRKEFTRLVELVYLGGLVAGAADGDSGRYTRRYGELAGKIYKLAATHEDGRPEYVEENEEIEGAFAPSFLLETDSPAAGALEKYENHVFWDELISRLAERDVRREEARNPSPPSDDPEAALEAQSKREDRQEARYRDEFVKNDLGNVFVMFGSDRLS